MRENFTSYSDRELVSFIQEGKSENLAFAELYNRHSVSVRAYCKFMLFNEYACEEVFQETFVFLYKNIKNGEMIANVQAYSISIARNLCRNYYRSKKIEREIEAEDLIVDDRARYENKELLEIIMKSLEVLEEKYREAFVLREFDGLSFQEIADILEISLSGAKSRFFRAHEQLMKVLNPYMKDLKEI